MITSLMVGLGLAILTALVGPPSAINIGDEFEETLEECSRDDAHEAETLAKFKTIREGLDAHQLEINTALASFGEVDTNYNATLEEYRGVNTSINEAWDQTMDYYFTQIIELRESFTPEEWAECSAIQDEVMDEEKEKTLKRLKKDQEKAEETETELEEKDADK